jgi:acyl carrier protein
MITIDDIKTLLENANLKGIKVNNLQEDLPLTEQGLDSLDMFNVFLNIEKKYTIKIEDSDFDFLKTIKDIVYFLNTKVG